MRIRGVIFDLDGTLIDSGLDFDRMRSDMGFAKGQLILETIDALPDEADRQRCLEILRNHELQGAQSATMMDGAADLLHELTRRQIPQALLTRNSRECTMLALERLQLEFSQVLTREDAPPKPDPTGLLHICANWGFAPSEVLFVGDFLFDILAGQRAGIKTVLYAPTGVPDYAHEADHVITHLGETLEFVG